MEQQDTCEPNVRHRTITFFEKKKEGMDQVKQLTDGSKVGHTGFSSANTVIKWGGEVKGIITQVVADTLHKEDKEHTLAIKEVSGETKRTLQALTDSLPLNTRMDTMMCNVNSTITTEEAAAIAATATEVMAVADAATKAATGTRNITHPPTLVHGPRI